MDLHHFQNKRSIYYKENNQGKKNVHLKQQFQKILRWKTIELSLIISKQDRIWMTKKKSTKRTPIVVSINDAKLPAFWKLQPNLWFLQVKFF